MLQRLSFMAQEREPRRTAIRVRRRAVMCCKNPSCDVLINKDPKRQADLCSDTRASPIWIAQLHFYDGVNQILSWTFRSGFRSLLRAKQKAIFQLHQVSVEIQNRGRLQYDR